MVQELILNIIGRDNIGILSCIASCIMDNDCNILDSRHAIYGQDFSVSMIVSGKESSISRLEVAICKLCADKQLLSMMKRTEGHVKQSLEQFIKLEFSGDDATGVMQKITHIISSFGVSISTLRQKTNKGKNGDYLDCKMVLSASNDLDLPSFDKNIKQTLHELGLSGQISHQISREDNEYIESW